MIYGIPLFRNRVAPRCTIADSILIVKFSINRIVSKTILKIHIDSWNDLLKIFSDNKVDTLVCGGINYESKKLSEEQGISVIDNVACSADEVLEAIVKGILKPGFGFSADSDYRLNSSGGISAKKNIGLSNDVDCINCKDYKCLEGKNCELSLQLNSNSENNAIREILNSALDVSLENERLLCRLSELIYFAIEMNYKKIGIAYCTELSEPAGIVALQLYCSVN